MTPEQAQAWYEYDIALKKWKRSHDPHTVRPRAPFQYGRHIDSLPIEVNEPCTENRLIVVAAS